ncbi:penicillin-binding transpeptidase domain-containing protein [Janibacter terrae]|uniref:Penicillin-binding transpeptidase domain-containing protein n=1 Tax=Janibacter terrae TaxID=103817 RepID=A0ABZ2FJN2_9MICO|nr:penicillin-binding transpeptidase domain-containing protein [Janibacter terrae]MBA4085672.1 cell division protein FtsI [Kytococcus sp.]HCE60883.1 cell division protein FtsI [Janibacter terrae]
MNQPIRRLSMLVAMLFVLLLGSSTWIQVLGSQDINDRPGNRRTQLESYARERGQILLGGRPIARSTPTQDDLQWQRRYSEPELYSHVTGWNSFTYGPGGGIESAADGLLSGRDDQLFYDRVTGTIAGREPKGASLELTINPRVQQAADEALGDQRGAVVALDPRTGAVLAMVSHPDFDPTPLVSHDPATEKKAWDSLNSDPARPLVNRAIGGNLYPPGSVFKIVTAAAAIEDGRWSEDSSIPGPAVLDLPQTDVGLPNSHPGACGPDDKVTLAVAMQDSCNTAFGWLGMELGGDAVREQAGKFGFGEDLDIPMSVTPSTVPEELSPPQEAQVGIGQYDVRVTPMQVAMVTAAVANDGVVMKPHLVQSVLGSDLSKIDETKPEQLSRAMEPETSDQLTDMMKLVVEQGTGTQGAVPGYSVAGKTGTAEHADDEAPHAWFTAFAPADNPQIAVAVVVEEGGRAGNEGYGGSVAGPISAAVMKAALQ